MSLILLVLYILIYKFRCHNADPGHETALSWAEILRLPTQRLTPNTQGLGLKRPSSTAQPFT